MEAAKSDVVLIMDQGNSKTPSMETELKDHIKREEKPQNTTRNLRRLSFSKPKARFIEYNYPNYTSQKTPNEMEPLFEKGYYSSNTEQNEEESDDDDDDEDDDEWKEDDGEMRPDQKRRMKKRKVPWRLVIEWVMFFMILTCLICSLTIESVKNMRKWGLEIWKWCLMVMVTFCGRLVSGWVMGFAVFLIERNFMLREKVLYFVYGLRKSIQNCVWLGLVLLAWTFMFNEKIHKKNKFLRKVFQALIAILLDATIWLVKIVLVKMLASSFHVATYFDRMKESVFHHYVLDTLSGPPMDEVVVEENKTHNLSASKSLPVSWKTKGKWKEGRNELKSKKFSSSRKIDVEKLRRLSMERTASVWSVKRLVNYVRSSGLSTISKTVDDFREAESEITSEWEARNAAKRIFKNVAKPGAK